MNLDEALTLAMDGERMHGDHMAEGQYVEHSMSRGYLRCWPVDRPEDEPNRTQCDFIPNDRDRAADWSVLERPKVDSWGKPLDDTSRGLNYALEAVGLVEYDEPRKTAQAVPWGDLKLNTPATVEQDERTEFQRLFAADGVPPPSPWGVAPGSAPKRDTWGRPID